MVKKYYTTFFAIFLPGLDQPPPAQMAKVLDKTEK